MTQQPPATDQTAALDAAWNDLLQHPGNGAVVNTLLAAMGSADPPIPFVGAGLHEGTGLPNWMAFLQAQARALDLPLSQPADPLLDAVLEAAGELFLRDALEDAYGTHRIVNLPSGHASLLPYITQDVVVTSDFTDLVDEAFARSGKSLVNRMPLATGSDSMLAFMSDAALTPAAPILVRLRSLHDEKGPTFSATAMAVQLQPPARLGSNLDQLLKRSQRPWLFMGLDSLLLQVIDRFGNVLSQNGPHFIVAPLSDRSPDFIKFCYGRGLRPVWVADGTLQFTALLAGLSRVLRKPLLARPERWLLHEAPQARYPQAVPTVAPAAPATSAVPAQAAEPALPPLDIPAELSDACLAHECIAFIGSGLSARAGLPTWRRFVAGIVDEAVKLGLMDAETARHQRAAMEDGELNAVADNAISVFGPQQREALLDYYRRSSELKPQLSLPAAHGLLRQIPFAGLLTSNYDTLLSRAFEGSDYVDGLTPDDAERLLDLHTKGERYLLQLYGRLDRPDSVAFAPADYQNLVRRNAAFARFVEGLFFSRTLLFLGTSLEGLGDFLSAFRFPSGVPRRHYAVVAVEGRRWQAMAQTLERRYNIKVLPFPVSPGFDELDDFLKRLCLCTRPAQHAAAAQNMPSGGPQLLRLELRDIGPFKELSLDLNSHWKVLLGDNGVGKSTILKSIALALVGSDARHVAARLLRAGTSFGSIKLVTQKNPSGYVAEIQRVGAGAEVVTHSGRALETEGWVALAFPPLRATSWLPTKGPSQGTTGRHANAADLLPLLTGEVDARMDDLKQWLVNTASWAQNQSASEDERARSTAILKSFFDVVRALTQGLDIQFKEITSDFRVLVQTPDGELPIEALSQGMSSLLSWIGIVVQRLHEAQATGTTVDPLHGYTLILMDEIDAHMHPAWQQGLVGKLKQLLPQAQIIASTHSPLVVAGMEVQEIIRFGRDASGAVVQREVDADMTEGRADQLLTGDLFGLDSTLALRKGTADDFDEYKRLLGKSTRTPQEERRYLELHQSLKQRIPPADAETKLERRAKDLVEAVLTADYSAQGLPQLKRELMRHCDAVAASMGWDPLTGGPPR